MSPAKLIAYLLFLLSLAVLVGALVAGLHPLFPSPFTDLVLSGQPQPVREAVPACASLLLLMIAAMLGAFAFALWRWGVRDARLREREAEAAASRETDFQARLDAVIPDLTRKDRTGPASPEEASSWATGLDPSLHARLYRFLAAGFPEQHRSMAAYPAVSHEPPPGTGSRILGFALAAVGLLACLWFGMTIPIILQDELFTLNQELLRGWGFAIGQAEFLLVGSGCFGASLITLLGGIGLLLLIRRGEAARGRREALRERARGICLEGWLRRISNLSRSSPQGDASGISPQVLRGCLMSAVADLDASWRRGLFSRLRDEGLLAQLPLQGLDLRGSNLSGLDFSAASLAGANLSGAVLYRARLAKADLRQGLLIGADLREADAHGAQLEQADLRGARLLRSNLRQANLRQAKLEGAVLWGADLTEAELQGATITSNQLAETGPGR